MRKPYKERAKSRETLQWESMKRNLKLDRLFICLMLSAHIALFLVMSRYGWDGSVFSFSPPAYLVLTMILVPVGALVLILVTGSAVYDAFREVRAIQQKIEDFKARHGVSDGQ
ncbi:MAG: hypothetical protein LBL73_07555 [Synergistaceae bacterium]|nr:hypothetical protein [Synergistaceae bacterium]